MNKSTANGNFEEYFKAAVLYIIFPLCLYLRSILKGYTDVLLAVHRHEIYQTRPQPLIKLCDWLLCEETAPAVSCGRLCQQSSGCPHRTTPCLFHSG